MVSSCVTIFECEREKKDYLRNDNGLKEGKSRFSNMCRFVFFRVVVEKPGKEQYLGKKKSN